MSHNDNILKHDARIFKNGLQRDDKSPTRSKIARFFLNKSGTHFYPFSDKDVSSTFRDTPQNATALSLGCTKSPFNSQGQQYPFNTDAIFPATYRTLERDVAIISLETLRQLAARHGSGMCGQENGGIKHNTEMK